MRHGMTKTDGVPLLLLLLLLANLMMIDSGAFW
jgi:hypothetical protein